MTKNGSFYGFQPVAPTSYHTKMRQNLRWCNSDKKEIQATLKQFTLFCFAAIFPLLVHGFGSEGQFNKRNSLFIVVEVQFQACQHHCSRKIKNLLRYCFKPYGIRCFTLIELHWITWLESFPYIEDILELCCDQICAFNSRAKRYSCISTTISWKW